MNTLPLFAHEGNPILRKCTNCKKSLPATPEFFSRAKKGKYGLEARCKECKKQYDQQHIEEKRENNRKWHLKNKSEEIERLRKYREEHKEEVKEYQKAYRETHREELKSKRVEYHRQYNREHVEQQREWHRKKRETPEGRMQSAATYHKRRANKLSNGGSYTVIQIQDKLRRQKNCCYYCGQRLGRSKYAYEIDHIVPLSRGGSNDIHNVVIACRTCNRSKGNKLLHEWSNSDRLC